MVIQIITGFPENHKPAFSSCSPDNAFFYTFTPGQVTHSAHHGIDNIFRVTQDDMMEEDFLYQVAFPDPDATAHAGAAGKDRPQNGNRILTISHFKSLPTLHPLEVGASPLQGRPRSGGEFLVSSPAVVLERDIP